MKNNEQCDHANYKRTHPFTFHEQNSGTLLIRPGKFHNDYKRDHLL